MRLSALLDSNVWVSAFLNPHGPPGRVVAALARGEFTLVSSPLQITEVDDVLRRPRLLRRFAYSHEDVHAFLRLIAARAVLASLPRQLSASGRNYGDVFSEDFQSLVPLIRSFSPEGRRAG